MPPRKPIPPISTPKPAATVKPVATVKPAATPPVKAKPDTWATDPELIGAARTQKAQSFIGSMDRKQQKQGVMGGQYEGVAPLTAQQRADKMADLTKRLNRGELTPQEFSQGASVVRKRRAAGAGGFPVRMIGKPYDLPVTPKPKGK